jgi:uncharacterized protein (DUF1330 family)
MARATLVVTALPNAEEPAAMQDYLRGVMPLFAEAGGTLVKRLKVDQVIEGSPSGMAMVMDFESAEAIEDLFASPGYAELLPARDRGFEDISILVTQEM